MQSVETWSLTPVSPERAKKYFDDIASYQNAAGETVISNRTSDKLMELFNGQGKGANMKSAQGTAWGLVNAVTEYIDHHKGASRLTDNANESRLRNAWFGAGDKIKSAVFAAAAELVR